MESATAACRISFKIQRDGNTSLTAWREDQDSVTEMSPVKAALLSLAMLAAIAVCGVGIYAADASTGHAVVDGYGVGSSTH